MLHGSDGIRAVVLTDTHAAEQALAQRRQLQPHAVFSNTVRNTAHFHLHAVGDGLNLHADRIPLPSTGLISVVPEDGSVISRSSVSVRVWLFTASTRHRC